MELDSSNQSQLPVNPKLNAFKRIKKTNYVIIASSLVLIGVITTLITVIKNDKKNELSDTDQITQDFSEYTVNSTQNSGQMTAQLLPVNSAKIAFSPEQAIKIRNYKSLSVEQIAFVEQVINRANSHLGQKPNPIQSIQMEGKQANDPARLATVQSLKDIHIIYDLGFAYTATNDPKYLEKSTEYLVSWAKYNIPTGNPINEDHLYPLIRGYDMVRDSMLASDRERVDTWLINIAELSKNYNLQWNLWRSNWNTHRLNVITQIAFLLEDEELKSYSRDKLKLQIMNNLNPDGSSFDFYERDAIHYHLYNLEPYLHMSNVYKIHNEDIYNFTASNSASIKKSIDFVIPYITGEKTHFEFNKSSASYDNANSQRGKPFNPTNALYVLNVNYLITGEHLMLITDLTKSKKKYTTIEQFLRSL